MKYVRYALLALLLPQAWAAYKPVSEATVALSRDEDCQWDVHTGKDCTVQQTLTVLQDAGRDEAGTQTLWYGQRETLTLLEAYTVQPDGSRLSLADRDRQQGSQAGENGFQSINFLKLAFPEVRTGSQVVLRYRKIEPPIRPFTALADRSVLSPSDWRIDLARYRIRSSQPLSWREKGFGGALTVTQNADRTEWQAELRNFFLNTTEQGRRLALRSAPQLEVSTEPDALRAEQPVGEAFAKLLRDPLPPRAAAVVDAVRGQPWRQQVATLLQDVNDRLRYMGDWRESENGYVPFALDQIEARGFGDCKDMALTLAAMLRAAGLPASVAFVRASLDNAPPLLTTFGYFNHAIVHLQMAGQDYWLDPTRKINLLEGVPASLEDRPAFVIAEDGRLQSRHIAANPQEARLEEQEVDLYPVAGQRWRLAGRSRLHGQEAASLFGDELASGASEANQALVSSNFLYDGMSLLSHRVTRGATQRLITSSYPVQVEAAVQGVARPLGAFRLADLRVLTARVAGWRDYLARGGVSDYWLERGGFRTTIRLHGVRPLAPPQACQVRSPWLDMAVRPVAVAGGVGLHYSLARKTGWIPAAELSSPAFARMLDELEACDGQAQLLLRR